MGNFAENLNLGNRFRPPPPPEYDRTQPILNHSPDKSPGRDESLLFLLELSTEPSVQLNIRFELP